MRERFSNIKKSRTYRVGKAIGSWCLFIVLFLAVVSTIMFHKTIREL
jgi:hypothetical protein